MVPFKSLIRSTLLLSVGIAAAACAPKDEQLTNRRSGGGSGGGTASSFDIEGREVNYARHTFLKVGEIRRMMNTALALPARASTPVNKSIPLAKCMDMKRMSPSSDTRVPAFSEKLMVNYFKCNEQSEMTNEASKSGPELYMVSYNAAIPREEDSNRVYPYPALIVVEARTVNVNFRLKSHAKDRFQVTQGVALNVELVAEDDQTLMYNAWYDGTDTFDYDVYLTRRSGRVSTSLKKAEIKVDKASRKVTSIIVPEMSFEMRGDQYTKSNPQGAQLSNRTYMNARLSFKSQQALKLSSNACDVPQGVYSMINQTNKDEQTTGTVTLGEGKIVVQGEDSSQITTKDVKFCKGQDEDPTFLEDLESVYF